MGRSGRSVPRTLNITVLVLCVSLVPAWALADTITLSGTLTDEDTAQPIVGARVGASRVASLGSGAPDDEIPVETTVTTDASGQYEIQVDDATPDIDRVLVFTRETGVVNELHNNVQFLGQIPTYADVANPGVVEIDFTHSVSGMDFALEPSSIGEKTTYMVEMTDGTHLATDVYLPDGPGPWPVLLYRTPYGKDSDGVGSWPGWNEHGYAVVTQDIRGTYDSEDIFRGFFDDGWGDNKDGYETCLWTLAQSWCNGKIGTLGGSARGISQNMLAGSVPPGLVCQDIGVAASNMYAQAVFQGGAFRKRLAEGWMAGRGPEAVEYMETVMKTHPHYDDDYWPFVNLETRYPLLSWPIVNRGGWYDIFLQGTINNFVGIQHNGRPGAQGKQRLIIEPYGHGYGSGGFYWPPGCTSPPALYANQQRWFDHWIKGIETGVTDEPPVCYYVLGDVDEPSGPGNEWRFAGNWPVPSRPVPFYFHEGGLLNTVPPSGSESPDTYVYDPDDPVPTLGGANLSGTKGPYDQRSVEPPTRDDVITFTTLVLDDYVEIAGKVTIELYASSSALDTDFTGKLCDVYPDGRSMLVCDGIIRARHRNTTRYDELMVPGTIYRFEIDLWETCIAFNAGHRIRVNISSSNYDRFDANPNTGDPWNEHTHTVPATNTIYHDAAHRSRMLLRVTGPDSNADGWPDVADLDGDGLPDDFEWRIINFDPEDGIVGLEDVRGEDDFDGDGLSNYDEFRYSTDPTQETPPVPVFGLVLALAILVMGGLLLARAHVPGFPL